MQSSSRGRAFIPGLAGASPATDPLKCGMRKLERGVTQTRSSAPSFEFRTPRFSALKV